MLAMSRLVDPPPSVIVIYRLGGMPPACFPEHLLLHLLLILLWPPSFDQDPYLVARWGEQEVRTSAKRDSGKACSWVKEEVALLVRTKKQLQEPIEIEASE